MSADPYAEDMADASSVRFEPKVLERLHAFMEAHPGLSLSAAGNLLVDEALRSTAHPLVIFVDGPSGRRARLSGGPDVDRIIGSLISTQKTKPHLSIDEVLTTVGEATDLPVSAIRAAVEYWAEFPEDIDERIRMEKARKARFEARTGPNPRRA